MYDHDILADGIGKAAQTGQISYRKKLLCTWSIASYTGLGLGLRFRVRYIRNHGTYIRIPDYVQNILWALFLRGTEILGSGMWRIPALAESKTVIRAHVDLVVPVTRKCSIWAKKSFGDMTTPDVAFFKKIRIWFEPTTCDCFDRFS